MDFDDISPFAYVAGGVGVLIGIYMSKSMGELSFIWKALTPVVSGLGAFFVMHKMSSD